MRYGKHHWTKFPKGVAKRATGPFEFIHSDVCGQTPMSVNGGSQYFVTFIDFPEGTKDANSMIQ